MDNRHLTNAPRSLVTHKSSKGGTLAHDSEDATWCNPYQFSGWVVLFAVSYYFGAELGQWLSVPSSKFITLWPPVGIYLAALTLTPRHRWWAILLAAWPSNWLFDVLRGQELLWPSVGFYLVNTAVAISGALLMRRYAVRPFRFESLRQVLVSAVGSAALTAIGAIGGSTIVWFFFRSPWFESWMQWWFADLVGLWFTGPLVLRVAESRRRRDRRPITNWRIVEFTAYIAAVVIVSQIVFGVWLKTLAFTSLILPFVMWGVLRFGSIGVKCAMLIVAISSLRAAIQSQGPIAGMSSSIQQAVLQTQFFLYAWSVFLHAVAAILIERQRANDELQRVNEELAYRVESRTAELLHANKTLHENDRRKDHFLAMLAHELRNPLAPIMNAIQILQQSRDSTPDARLAREMIERQVRHMARLVDDLLDVARIGRGKIQVNRRRTNLVQIMREVAEDHRPVLEQRQLTFLVDIPEAPLWINGDDTRLAQMVGNLLHNANKFTEAGGVVVLRLACEGRTAVIRVSDTGIGMDEETQTHVFEAFSQADNSLVRSQGGLGLGLALVKGLASLHGGDVHVESAGVGCGTSFTLRLPLENPPDPKEIANTEPSHPAVPTHRRLLIIEDNFDAATSMKTLLEMRGYEVLVAHSGHEGVELARLHLPDVVICDIGLPGMDGFQVGQTLRQDPLTRDIFLISQSGYGQQDDIHRAESAGFDIHLTKPVDFSHLESVLAR